VHDYVEAHLGSGDVARVIYGATIGLALVLAVQEHPPGSLTMAGLLFGTAIAVGLAELYAEFISAEARTRHAVGRAQLGHMAVDSLAVIFGTGFPCVFFLLAAAGVYDDHLAYTLSKWTGAGLIGLYAYVAARLSGSTVLWSIVHAAAIGAVGVALIGAKSLLH
jgi:hypothetical protein